MLPQVVLAEVADKLVGEPGEAVLLFALGAVLFGGIAQCASSWWLRLAVLAFSLSLPVWCHEPEIHRLAKLEGAEAIYWAGLAPAAGPAVGCLVGLLAAGMARPCGRSENQ